MIRPLRAHPRNQHQAPHQAGPEELAGCARRHWQIEKTLYRSGDVTSARSQVRTRPAPAGHDLAAQTLIGLHRLAGATDIAAALPRAARNSLRPLQLLMIIRLCRPCRQRRRSSRRAPFGPTRLPLGAPRSASVLTVSPVHCSTRKARCSSGRRLRTSSSRRLGDVASPGFRSGPVCGPAASPTMSGSDGRKPPTRRYGEH